MAGRAGAPEARDPARYVGNEDLDFRRAAAALPGIVAGRQALACDHRSGHRHPRPLARRCVGRNPARTSRGTWSGGRRCAGGAAWRDGWRDRGRARGSAGGRLRHARALYVGRNDGRMVRAPPARAHPPLHRQAAAGGDRAGRGARLPALPLRLAACRAGCTHGGAGRHRHRAGAARRLRGAGRCLGERDPVGAARRLRGALARCPLPCRAGELGAVASRKRPIERRKPRNAGAHHADHASGTPSRSVLGIAGVAGRGRAAQPARASGARSHPCRGCIVLRRADGGRRAVALAGGRSLG